MDSPYGRHKPRFLQMTQTDCANCEKHAVKKGKEIVEENSW